MDGACRSHVFCLHPQHLGVHAHRLAHRYFGGLFHYRGDMRTHDHGVRLGRHAAVLAADDRRLAGRVQAVVAGRAHGVRGWSGFFRCCPDVFPARPRAHRCGKRPRHFLVDCRRHGDAPCRRSARVARHRHDRHGLFDRADIRPAAWTRDWPRPGLAHDVRRGGRYRHRHHRVSGGGAADNSRRKALYVGATAAPLQEPTTGGYVWGDHVVRHGLLHLLQLHRAVFAAGRLVRCGHDHRFADGVRRCRDPGEHALFSLV